MAQFRAQRVSVASGLLEAVPESVRVQSALLARRVDLEPYCGVEALPGPQHVCCNDIVNATSDGLVRRLDGQLVGLV